MRARKKASLVRGCEATPLSNRSYLFLPDPLPLLLVLLPSASLPGPELALDPVPDPEPDMAPEFDPEPDPARALRQVSNSSENFL